MNIETKIHLDQFQPRWYQLPIIDAIENKGYRRVLAILPRRAGKDITAWNLAIRQALMHVGVYYYIFPTYSQGKKVIWDSVTIDGKRFLDFIPSECIESLNSQEMKVRFFNGSLIQIVGSDNIDSLVGTNPIGIVYSEYALQLSTAYSFLRPVLAANDGWAVFLSCVTGDTTVITNRGPMMIQDVCAGRSQYNDLENTHIYGLGGYHQSTDFYFSRNKPLLKITTQHGYSISCTPNHQLWNGKEWIRADHYPLTGEIPIQYDQQTFGPGINLEPLFRNAPEHSEDGIEPEIYADTCCSHFFYLVGILFKSADIEKSMVIHLTTPKFVEQISFLRRWGFVPYDKRRNAHPTSCLRSRRLVYILKKVFEFDNYRCNRVFPKIMYQANKEQMTAFLQGIFDVSATKETRRTHAFVIHYPTEVPLFDIQKILLLYGILSKLSSNTSGGRLYIPAYSIENFYKHIGFRVSAKKKWHEEYLEKPSMRSGFRTEISTSGDKFFYTKISRIECLTGDVYDFVIPDSHSFFSNGFISHNTPRGKNHLYELLQIAERSPHWFSYKMTIEDTQHIPLEEIEKEKQEGIMSEDLIQQEYYCFPEGQNVLAVNGSVDIKDIHVNDMVISHTGRLRKVTQIISREYEGELFEISSYGSCETVICTPNHPIRVYNQKEQSYCWKQARCINLDDRLVFPKMILGEYKVIDYNLCMLIAWFITEGSCFQNEVQWTVKEEESLILGEYLNKLKIPFNYQKNGCVINVLVNSVQLVDFFKSTCGLQSNNKRIPFHLICGYEDEFFHELIKGDWYYNISKNHEKYCFTTVSKTLAYQIQLLANSINLGYAAGITKIDSYKGIIKGRNDSCQVSYRINISFPGLISSGELIRAKNCIAAKVISVDKKLFKGKVYNFGVQYDESYVVQGRAVHNCSFDMGVEGNIYGKHLDRMRVKGQIGDVPWEPSFKVHTAWDIGVADSTSIIFFQNIGQTIRIIDYYEKSGVGLDHYVKVIQSKDYIYGKHVAPHDMRQRVWTEGAITRIEKARQMGINFVIADDIEIVDGIEAVRASLNKIWIDQRNCATLIKCLENYRYEWDARRSMYKTQPLHNWASHAADSLRYLCVSLPKTRDSLSAEDLEKRYQEAVFGKNANMPSVFRDDLPPY